MPHIVDNGAEWFKGLSRTEDGGTKLYGVSGQVKRPGLWELPMGTTLRELLEEHAGGMRDGLQLPRPAARRRLDRLPDGASTWTCRWTSTSLMKVGQPPGHRAR